MPHDFLGFYANVSAPWPAMTRSNQPLQVASGLTFTGVFLTLSRTQAFAVWSSGYGINDAVAPAEHQARRPCRDEAHGSDSSGGSAPI